MMPRQTPHVLKKIKNLHEQNFEGGAKKQAIG